MKIQLCIRIQIQILSLLFEAAVQVGGGLKQTPDDFKYNYKYKHKYEYEYNNHTYKNTSPLSPFLMQAIQEGGRF